jgi:hypothetical protein
VMKRGSRIACLADFGDVFSSFFGSIFVNDSAGGGANK